MLPSTAHPRVDFSYAFATPHRLTVALPDASDKTLLDLQPGFLRMAWTYDTLLDKPLAAFVTPPTQWELHITPALDGQPFAESAWTRAGGWLPVLENRYTDPRGTLTLTVAGGEDAAIARIELHNAGSVPQTFTLTVASSSFWGGQNPAWVNPNWPGDHLQAGWRERADRVLVLGSGADQYAAPTMGTVEMSWTLAPDETRRAWLVRPYRAYAADLPGLRAADWEAAFTEAVQRWYDLIDRAARVHIPDPGVANGFYACFADIFVMSEPVAQGYLACCPGTEVYRAPNAFEAGTAMVAVDQLGLHGEAERAYQMCLDLQEPDGDWTEPKGWSHHMWGASGFKAWVGMEHYRLTRDRAYLEALYPRLRASSHWQEAQRAQTRVLQDGARTATYGLMPRGMGDAGLMNDDDLYGIYLPHNILAVYADKASVEAAEILGMTEDLPALRRIYATALDDLLQAIEAGAIAEEDYRWMPAVPGKTSGSRWGTLYAAVPCRLLSPRHPLIDGTIRKMESRISPGGIPVHLGWQPDGLWVAIALDNLAEALLVRDEGDRAAAYLYATLNHATPLYTWCEERGQEPGAADCAGDRQHLWTPVAVVRFLRDALVLEDDALHLARGIARDWLAAGPVGIERAATHFGTISYTLQLDAENGQLHGTIRLAPAAHPPRVVLHLRLPGGLRPAAAPDGAALSADGTTLTWEAFSGETRFSVAVGCGA